MGEIITSNPNYIHLKLHFTYRSVHKVVPVTKLAPQYFDKNSQTLKFRKKIKSAGKVLKIRRKLLSRKKVF